MSTFDISGVNLPSQPTWHGRHFLQLSHSNYHLISTLPPTHPLSTLHTSNQWILNIMDMPSPPPAQLGRLRSAAPPSTPIPADPVPPHNNCIIVVVSSSSSWYGALYSIADSPLIDNPHRILVTADSTVKSSPYLCRIVITADATITEEYHRSRHRFVSSSRWSAIIPLPTRRSSSRECITIRTTVAVATKLSFVWFKIGSKIKTTINNWNGK